MQGMGKDRGARGQQPKTQNALLARPRARRDPPRPLTAQLRPAAPPRNNSLLGAAQRRPSN
eukprot:942347-Lingulodinium_polyedra.AAC.1